MKPAVIAVCAAALASLAVAACFSTPPAPPAPSAGKSAPEAAGALGEAGARAEEVVAHKGSEAGIAEIPAWLRAYLEGGAAEMERMPDYSGLYCFVAEARGEGETFPQTWAAGVSPRETAEAQLRRRLRGKAALSGGRADAIAAGVNLDAYAGVRKINDWWLLVRVFDGTHTPSYEYRAYAFYTAERALIDPLVLRGIDGVIAAAPEARAEAETLKALVAESGL